MMYKTLADLSDAKVGYVSYFSEYLRMIYFAVGLYHFLHTFPFRDLS